MDKQEKLIARLFKDTLIIFLLSMFAEKAGTFIDGVVTGKFLGTEAIAAFGLTVPYQNFAAMFIRVMALGMQILCSKILGVGKLREANGIFSLALTVAVGVAIVMFGITILFTGQIIDLLGTTAEHDSIRALAIDFLQAYSFALPAIALATIFTPIMQLDNDRRRAVISVVVLSISNIAGDLINIFVLEGGLWGMGIATAISYWFAAGFLFLHFLKPTANFKFTLDATDLKNFHEMFLIGSPVIMVNVSLILRKNIFNRLALNLSSGAGLAAYTILGSVSEVLETLTNAAASTMQLISGIFIGERDKHSVRKLLKISLRLTLTITPIITLVTFVAAPFIADLYTRDDPETYLQTVDAIRWFAPGLPLYTFSLVLRSFYQSYGRFRLSSFLSIWNILLFSVPTAFVLSKIFDISALWYTLFLNQVAYVLIVFVITCRFHRRITFKLEDYLLLPEDFDVSKDKQLNITVTNKGEVLGLSERTQNFCETHGIDERRSIFAGICIEEMAGNIVDYGFDDGNKHFVDVRVIIDGEQVIIRIRDDCQAFDPKKWAEIHNPEDPAAHIGIRLCRKIATEFNYVNVLKLNNLILKI